MHKVIVLRVAIALSAVCAIFVGFFAPVALAEPAAPRSGVSADHGLLLLTSTGEILRMAEDGSISPAEPYLPALIPARVFPNTDSTTFIKKPITTAKRQLGTSRWDHGSLDDPQNWYQITGISYNALGNASDGTLYAMLRVTSHTRQINGVVYRGLYRAYRLTPGDTYWQPYGADFYLPADTVPPESQQPQPITAGAVSPIDNKYYFGSAVQDPWDQQTYFHLYRMEPQNGSSSSADATPVYVGKSLIRPAYNSEGQPISSAAGDISFTSDGSLVIGASVHDRDGEQSLVRMQVIRRDVLAATENRLGGELSAFYLPTIATLYRTGEYYSASYDENKVEEASGFATLADGSLITSHKGNLGHSYLLKATYDWRNATTPGSEGAVSLPSKIFAKIDDSELASETLPSPFDQRKCVNFAPIGDAGWTDMNSYARCYIGQDGRTWLRSQQLFNTVVVDMAGSMEWMPSVKLKKDVTNRRISDSDQFKLAITAGRADLTFDEVTTSGTATGVQTASAGPIPVAAGTTLTFSETITSSTNLHQYRPQFSCVDGNGKSFAVEPTVTESKASASVTVPEDTANGIDLTCTFTNKAIVTHNLKVIKVDSTHENGAEQLPPLGGAQLRLWKDKDGNGQLDENVDTLARAESTVPVLDQSNDSLTTGKTGLALWKGLESGKYLVEEVNAPHGYKESAPLAVTIADKDVEVVLKNTQILGTLIFEKRAAANKAGASGGASSGKLLEGSEWKLTLSHAAIAQPTGATPVEFRLADCAVATSTGSASAGSSNACTGAAALDKDPTPGVMKITNLPLGTYTLQEMKAPSGYILDPSQHSITLDSEEPYTLTGAKAILNEQRTGPALPLSGGVGRDFFLLAGGGTLIAALTVSLIMLGRRRTQKLG